MAEYTEQTDYYELLGVPEDVSQDALKRAYRKAAMKWHPDRNHGNEKEATRVFQLIEHAYSILSDDHERAWYDGHRNLVHGEDGQIKATKVDIMGLFHACAYIGFQEGARGFYTVFRKAFATLAEEEKCSAPGFGNAQSDWKSVSAFYDHWSCFTTKRNFGFTEIYKLNEAPNAVYRRIMKQENEKAKQKAEKEFVESVRELVQYVKKRDPRVIQHIKQMEEEKQAKRAEEEKKKLERARQIQEEIEACQVQIEYTEDDLAYVRQFADKEQTDKWNCPLCGSKIKNEKAFRQHCKTKKHAKVASVAKAKFMLNGEGFEPTAFNFVLLDMNEYEIESVTGIANFDLSNLENDEPVVESPVQEDVLDEDEEEEEEVKPKKAPMSKKEKRKMMMKQKQQNKKKNLSDDDDDAPRGFKLSDDEDEEDTRKVQQPLSKKEARRMKIKEEREQKLAQQKADAEAKKQMKMEKNEQRKQKQGDEEPKPQPPKPAQTQKKKGKGKQAQTEEEEQHEEVIQDGPARPTRVFAPKGMKNPPPGQFMCRKCRELFPSKTKLFAHLEETKHMTAY